MAGVDNKVGKIWNDKEWLAGFNKSKVSRSIHNIMVYQSTVAAVKQGYYYLEDGTRVELSLSPDLASKTVMYATKLPVRPSRFEGEALVRVVASDCLEAARRLVEAGVGRVAVLNMASSRNPGGGVSNGSGAQEEYLFRCSDYFRSLYQYVDYGHDYGVERNREQSYPLDANYGGVYSKDVTVIRGPQEEGYPFIAEPWRVDMLAVAGVNWSYVKK